ncbi:hypothetical protein A5630_15485 [Mycolicibacterium mucogenicum]|uniref:3-ketoacyl-ACP reductase n=1 Tax=Mycolicibacterium mucogenicum TaxID=56689 RepID=A0A1A3HB17_MYCMU|nr:mycofactocin-coupled SDR family oxidoreductase [Mycolicibacterium mucogenicum]OBJ44808.1 hypothetical protein A5630_15485 [Mycolicibacterium mucogenicum]
MNRFNSQVVFITGAARGQGRAHAVRFAAEGASIIAVDACAPMPGTKYSMATEQDLAETRRLVESVGGQIVIVRADVRSQAQLDRAVAEGVERFGGLDVVIANAGIFTHTENTWLMTEEEWSTTIDVDLSGVWRTCKAAIPALIAGGRGGSILMISSSNGYRAEKGHSSYGAAKLGMVALMRTLAAELADHLIRVNTVHPTTVKTDMMWNDAMLEIFGTGHTTATIDPEVWWKTASSINLLPTPVLEPDDVSALLLFLASEEGRFITAAEVPIDAGYIRKN